MTVWDGVYTEAQAARGRQVYSRYCASCHMDDLLGSTTTYAAPLVGDDFTLRWDGKPLYEMLDRIRRQMPPDGTLLTAQEYTDLVSFMLNANKYPTGDAELPTDTERLKQIVFQASAPRE